MSVGAGARWGGACVHTGRSKGSGVTRVDKMQMPGAARGCSQPPTCEQHQLPGWPEHVSVHLQVQPGQVGAMRLHEARLLSRFYDVYLSDQTPE